MKIDLHSENMTALAFSAQAPVFDAMYSDTITAYKRQRVRDHVMRYHLPGKMLELNAGTGEDAVFFAGKGFAMHATDLSPGMIGVMKKKIAGLGLDEMISTEQCSFSRLDGLRNKGPYDSLFSNFAGLNCSPQLKDVLSCFDLLINKGGMVTLVIMPRFCLWEMMLVFRGKFRTATRRFLNRKGADAKIDGHSFKCWYYQPSYVKHHLKNFSHISTEGLCTFVPPSYMQGFAEKFPRLFRLLQKIEKKLSTRWPWKLLGDYYIITFRKR